MKKIKAVVVLVGLMFISFAYANDWNDFVFKYQDARDNAFVLLDKNIMAQDYDSPFLTGRDSNYVTVNGKNNTIDSNNKIDLSFQIYERIITFKDIKFKNFENGPDPLGIYGSVFNIGVNAEIHFEGAINFENNTGKQGAIYALESRIFFVNSVTTFKNNHSQANAGAIYVKGTDITPASLIFRDSTIYFSNNLADGVGNDVYMNEFSTLYFAGNVNFTNGIRVGSVGAVSKREVGQVVFSGAVTTLPDFHIDKGAAVFKARENIVSNLEIARNAKLSLKNGSENYLYINGNLYIKENSIIELDHDDLITVSNMLYINSPTSIWKINFSGANTAVGEHEELVAVLGGNGYIDGAPVNYEDTVISNGNSIRYGVYDTRYSDTTIEGFRGIFLEILGVTPIPIIALGVSPKFIANTIKSAATNTDSQIYANINENYWISVAFGGASVKDEKDAEAFVSDSFGVKAGWKFFDGGDLLAGVFVGMDSKTFKQASDNGTATDLGFGLYGAWTASEKISVKANAGMGMQSVSAKNAEFDATADFKTMSMRFGAEADYNLGKLKPFIGINGGYVSNPEISAKTAGETVATIGANTYLRLSGLAGLKIEKDNASGKFNWFGKGYFGLLLSGAEAEYTVTPKSETETVAGYTVNASEESTLFFGLGAGLGYSLTKNVTAKVGFDLNFAGSGTAYLGNVGLSYKF